MDAVLQDLRHALRAFSKAPGFTVTTLATLALGIGAGTAIFSVVDHVLLRPLPFRDQDRIVVMWAEHGRAGSDHLPLSYADFRDYRRASRTFDDVTAVDYNGAWPRAVQLDRGDGKMNVAFVAGNLFRVLGGGDAEIGRVLTSDDDQSGVAPVVVISQGLWERQFGRDTAVLGSSLRFFGKEAQVVGVVPRGLDYPEGTEVWAPIIPFTGGSDGQSSWVFVHLVGRLKGDATTQQAKADLDMFLQREGAAYPADLRGMTGVARSLKDVIVGPARSLLTILAGAVVLVFLVTCATVANLSLVRSIARLHEFAARSALGASTSRIASQLLTESTVLAALAGVFALSVAHGATKGFIALAPVGVPRLDQIDLDARVLAFAVILSLSTVLLFGLAPALWASRAAGRALLVRGVRSPAGSRGAERARRVFVGLQIALALIVLVAAGLLVDSFRRLRNVDLGFADDNVLVAELAVGYGTNPTGDYVALVERLADRIQSLPGVAAATPAALPPFSGTSGLDTYVRREGEGAPAGSNTLVNLLPAAPQYFRTLQIPLLSGRTFTQDDRESTGSVVLVSQEAARRIWGTENPVGRRIRLGRAAAQPLRTVVGVVGDTRYRGYTDVRPTVYVPPRQFSTAGLVYMVVRTSLSQASLAADIRRLVALEAPGLYVPAVTTVEGYAQRPLARPRMSAVLMTGCATMVVLLAAIGLYGIMAAFVRQHEHELGIRMALGASPNDIRRFVFGTVLRITLSGLAVGAAMTLAGGRALQALLFEVSATNLGVLAAAVAFLGIVAVLASLGPTRRATRVDPMVALRTE